MRYLYYECKPFIPQTARLAFRRRLARNILASCSTVWPINPATSVPPRNWTGWPGGKKFALVLTHDVEGPAGVAKCRTLMKLESSLGLRSCFNFIPEGSYKTPLELRHELMDSGFEVGLHDLRHDGKLYRSRKHFTEAAKRINFYLRDWNAVGFRSGFMHHNLDWLHDLNIAYDMSTFDTDPFEPQPDAVGTIFPFWVPSPSSSVLSPRSSAPRSSLPQTPASNLQPLALSPQPFSGGYLELPYTLPQDSTMFLVLREQSTAIWRKKLDWVAAQGGMALVNVHPDYINTEDRHETFTYPVSLYKDLLLYITSKYKDDYWMALPREVAANTNLSALFSTSTVAALA